MNNTKNKILSFDDALKKSELNNNEYDVKKWIFIPNIYLEYRFILGTKGKKPLICIGINPSTAKPDNLDNTLKSVEKISLNNNFDSFIMFNVYPQRATNPNDMHLSLDKNLHQENLKAFEYILKISNKPQIWAAWGTIVEKREYLKTCLIDMLKISKKYNTTWNKVGKISKKGHPHHPLYLKKDSKLEDFDIDNYLEKVLK